MLVQSVSVFSLAVFLWALLPEIKWMMMMMMTIALVKGGTLHLNVFLNPFYESPQHRVVALKERLQSIMPAFSHLFFHLVDSQMRQSGLLVTAVIVFRIAVTYDVMSFGC